MSKKLMRRGRGALYIQVAELLKRRVVSSHWLPGERLPSIEEMANEFSVAIVTVRQAVGILEEEGLLIRRQGLGTFVADGVADRKWVTLESTWEAMLKKWKSSRAKILKQKDATRTPALDEEDGTPAPAYRYLKRVHLSDETPYAVINIYIDKRLFALAPGRFQKEMVILVLESLPDVEIARANQTVTIGTADVEVAELLHIPLNSPVGEVRRVITDKDGTIIYVGEATYRADMVRLEFSLSPHRD